MLGGGGLGNTMRLGPGLKGTRQVTPGPPLCRELRGNSEGTPRELSGNSAGTQRELRELSGNSAGTQGTQPAHIGELRRELRGSLPSDAHRPMGVVLPIQSDHLANGRIGS